MRYLGGKTRLARRLVDTMIARSGVDPARTTIVDGCCGAGSVSVRMVKAGFRRVVMFDGHPAIVGLWRALFDGWQPPMRVTEDEYKAVKHGPRDPSDPMTGFCMTGVTFAGKPWDSYARSSDRASYAAQSARSLLRKIAVLRGRASVRLSRHEVFKTYRGAVHYVDPPYEGTTGYEITGGDVWATARRWARDGAAAVFVSEYSGPSDAVPVWRGRGNPGGLGDKAGRVETLFQVRHAIPRR